MANPVTSADFWTSGQYLAYAHDYDWSKGSSYHTPGTPNEIFIHYTPEEEIKPKGKKTSSRR